MGREQTFPLADMKCGVELVMVDKLGEEHLATRMLAAAEGLSRRGGHDPKDAFFHIFLGVSNYE